MKKKIHVVVIVMLSLILFNCFNVNSMKVDKVRINTDYEIGGVSYKNYNILVKKILIGDEIGYCLDIEKQYPNGEIFTETGVVDQVIEKALLAGYPNKSANELGLEKDDDAYMATQIAIWSIIEKFDVEEIVSEDDKIVKAIKEIFYTATKGEIDVKAGSFKIYSTNDVVQRVVIGKYMKKAEDIKDIEIPERPEKEKNNYPSQEKIKEIPAERG